MAGIILAGGASRRMGRDKALIEWEGRTLIDRVVEIVGEVTRPVLVVGGSEELRSCLSGAHFVVDRIPGGGPLGGLIAGLEAAGPGVHAAVACDMPLLKPDLLRLLLEESAGRGAVVPEVNGRLEPLCAAYDARCLSMLQAAWDSGIRALHEAVGRLDANLVPESRLRMVDPELRSLMNVNTEADLAGLSSDPSDQSDECGPSDATTTPNAQRPTPDALTHLDSAGAARMVDVSAKPDSIRVAVARGVVLLKAETIQLLRDGAVPKGDAIAAARIAGIMAAKRTGDLIPLCHPLPITRAEVSLAILDDRVEIEAAVSITGKTGVEMEALTAVSVAALTLYDMVKAVDKAAVITDIRLISKSGGKSGNYSRG